mmetsp:Transcript_11872/g.28775  ORF Transcript_11872/g.28775 Transcript_11872/m.28775 type:complete len:225 (+) Transcript_11872:1429-2103(+)
MWGAAQGGCGGACGRTRAIRGCLCGVLLSPGCGCDLFFFLLRADAVLLFQFLVGKIVEHSRQRDCFSARPLLGQEVLVFVQNQRVGADQRLPDRDEDVEELLLQKLHRVRRQRPGPHVVPLHLVLRQPALRSGAGSRSSWTQATRPAEGPRRGHYQALAGVCPVAVAVGEALLVLEKVLGPALGAVANVTPLRLVERGVQRLLGLVHVEQLDHRVHNRVPAVPF